MSTRHLKLVFLWLGLLIAAIYAGSLNGSFHFDDTHSIESNPAIWTPLNIPSFWTDPRTSSFIPENRVYRPLVYTFYSFCWWIGGGKTWPFHVMKLVMHWLVTMALFLIWQRLWSERKWFPVQSFNIRFPFLKTDLTLTPTWAAFLLATVFAVHPAGSECVDYIAATTSLQCAMFYIWAFYSYLRYRDTNNPWKLTLALFLYFLSVASKEEGITLPAMVLITECFLSSKTAWARITQAVKTAIPFAVLGLLLAAWIYKLRPVSGDESRGYATSWQYFMTQWRAYLVYMRMWFWPWGLNADNASIEFSKSILDPLTTQALVANLLIVAIAWFNRNRFPAFLFGIVWFYVTISPASSVVVLAEAVNEHRMYLAYIGFVGGTFTLLLAAANAFLSAGNRERRLGWIYAMVVAALMIGTQERNRVWANDENLWLDTVEKNPNSGRAMNNLGLVYMARGDFEKANVYFMNCQKVWPTYDYCALNLGISYQASARAAEKSGRSEDATAKFALAEKSLLRAYQLNSSSVHVNFHLAEFHEHARDYAKAADLYKAAIERTGGRYPSAEMRLAACLMKLQKFDEAKAAFHRAVAVEPMNNGLFFEMGRLELENGDFDSAAATYRKLLERNPSYVQAWYNYGVAELRGKNFAQAKKAFEKTVSLDSASEQGWYNLAYVAEHLGEIDTAIDAFKRLLELNPKRPGYQQRLAALSARRAVKISDQQRSGIK